MNYELSLSYANAGNFAKWRELIHKEKVEAGAEMLRWKAENQKNTPPLKKDFPYFFCLEWRLIAIYSLLHSGLSIQRMSDSTIS